MTRPWNRNRSMDLQAGFWFTALATALLGPVLVVVVLLFDKRAGNAGVFDWAIISPTSARTILGAIAGSLITIASLTSSLTIVTLQLLSSQYTPRAIRGFLRTRLAQTVFGTFVGIFAYCLMLLVTIRAPGEANEPFVPSLGVFVGILLALGSLGLLVVFVHRLSQLIQVSTMTSVIAADTVTAIARCHCDPFGSAQVPAPRIDGDGAVRGTRIGYVQRVNVDRLRAAAGSGAAIVVHVRPGDFVTRRTPLLSGCGAAARMAAWVTVGTERDLDQDPTFGVRQLVDIAVRALSPGINDPTTAVTCIHYLEEVLQTVVACHLSPWVALGPPETVLAAGRVLEDYLEPLREIATYGFSDPRIKREVTAALDSVAAVGDREGAREPAATVRAFAAAL